MRTGQRGSDGRTFRALRNRDFRIFVSGQLISMAGTFMQAVAQAWLVLQLSGGGNALGIVVALQFLPVLLLSPAAGVLVDRFDRRRLYLGTQSIAALNALVLGLITASGHANVSVVYVFALLLGVVTALDAPLKSTLVMDIVVDDDLTNAVALNLSLLNLSRVIGPGIAGFTIAAVGAAPCFLLNAASYVAVMVTLVLVRPARPRATTTPSRSRQTAAGLAYVRRSPEILVLLVMAAAFYGLAWEFDVVLPLLARFTFRSGPEAYGMLSASLGFGAVIGALLAGRVRLLTTHVLLGNAVGFGVAMLATAAAPNLVAAVAALVVVGAFGMAFTSLCSVRLQVAAADEMRGRVMAMWNMAVVGMRPIGGPATGFVGETLGARFALGLGAAVVLLFVVPLGLRLPPEPGSSQRGDERDPTLADVRAVADPQPAPPV